MARLTLDRARRMALAAQGLHRPRPDGRADVRHLRRALGRNDVVQVDSVSVAARAHELPFWSRVGAHDRRRRDDWLWRSDEVVEVTAHEASLVPVEVYPLLRHRMTAHRWRAVEGLAQERPGYVEQVLDQVGERGPLSTGELDDPGTRGGEFWGWSAGRIALTWLTGTGRLAVAERDERFQLRFDLVERVVPEEVLAVGVVPAADARRALLLRAAAAHGFGTAHDLADHWRMGVRDARPVLDELVAAGELERGEVRGWADPVYRHPEAPIPREASGRALLSPFDPLVWFRPRLQRLWHVEHRLEIYVPQAQRRWGYYVLPFLLDDALVARVDLKADRRSGVLDVAAAWSEDGVDRVRVAAELAVELAEHAGWLGLGDVRVAARGDLAADLRTAVARV